MNERLNKVGARAKANPQDRILVAAEKVFAEVGFEAASMRQIVKLARVNLATVYYYFGSKEGLIAAVIDRRFGPLRQEHLDLLQQYERGAGGQPLPVEKILEAMLLPPLRLADTAAAKAQPVLRLIGRFVTEPNPQFQELLRRQTTQARTAFLAALQRSLPGLPNADLQWRFEFFWGALAFILCNPRKIENMTDGACNPADTRAVLAQMIPFFSAGLRAPACGAEAPAPAAGAGRRKPAAGQALSQ